MTTPWLHSGAVALHESSLRRVPESALLDLTRRDPLGDRKRARARCPKRPQAGPKPLTRFGLASCDRRRHAANHERRRVEELVGEPDSLVLILARLRRLLVAHVR